MTPRLKDSKLREASCLVLAWAMSIIFNITYARATTFISGELPQTLQASGSPYIALSELTITGHECFIEPGVEINFTLNTRIDLRQGAHPSSLAVGGTAENPVVLRGWNGERWIGIRSLSGSPFAIRADWLVIESADESFFLGGPSQCAFQLRDCTISGLGGRRGIYMTMESTWDVTIERVNVTGITVNGGGHEGTGIAIQNGASLLTIRESSVTDSFRGFWLFGSISGDQLSAANNTIGIVLSSIPNASMSLSGCQAINNLQDGVYVDGTGTPVPITDTVITGNGVHGITFSHQVVVNGCTIHDNGQWDAHAQTYVIPITTIDMRNNYWGAATTAEMQAEGTFSNIEKIYDWWDNSQFSLVDYEGFIVPTSVAEPLKSASWGAIKASYR